jgi:hypothetical protein
LNKICAIIAIAWIVAVTLASLPAMGWRDNKLEERIAKRICIPISLPSYSVFVGTITFYGPFIVISILYWLIFLIARKSIRCKLGNKTAVETAETRTKTKEISIKMKKMSSVKGSNSGLRAQTASEVRKFFLSVPNLNVSELGTSESKKEEVKLSVNKIDKEEKSFRNLSGTSSVSGINGEKSPESSSYSPQSKRERIIAKALAIVTLTYVVCLAPLYLISLVLAAMKPQMPPRLLFSFAISLGLVNSMINPFIYARFKPQFRNLKDS